VLALGDDAVDDLLEQVLDAGGGENVAAVRARGDDGAAQPRGSGRFHVANRALVGLHPVLANQLEHDLVLEIAKSTDRIRARLLIGAPLR